jgi:hypothetical protein
MVSYHMESNTPLDRQPSYRAMDLSLEAITADEPETLTGHWATSVSPWTPVESISAVRDCYYQENLYWVSSPYMIEGLCNPLCV